MKTILVGAPGSGKSKLAAELGMPDLSGKVAWSGLEKIDPDHQIGDLADYRIELTIATDRVQTAYLDGIHTHSLLDSLAYVAVRLNRMAQQENVTEREATRWFILSQIVLQLLQDSFQSDRIIYLPGNDGTEFGRSIEVGLRLLLEELNLDYEVLTPGADVATIEQHG